MQHAPGNLSTPRPAVFFDRDGTLMEEVHYCRDPQLVRVMPGAAAALRRLREVGFINIVVTNQSGIGRGIITPDEYEAVNRVFLESLDGQIDAVYFCPDSPERSGTRRKPAPGMLHEARADWNIDFAASWLIGDKQIDLQCARAAGLRAILVQTGYGRETDSSLADFIATDIVSACGIVIEATLSQTHSTPIRKLTTVRTP